MTPYNGYRAEMHDNQSSKVVISRWTALAKEASMCLRASRTESHNSLSVGERYSSVAMHLF